MDLLNAIFIDPFYNALIFFYNLTGDMGLAIIAITLLVRVAMLPLANKALRSQRRMQALQPELQKLQQKHKDDREAMAREVMAFYRKEGVNPASSCLPTLVQIPILVALFFVFKDAVTGHEHTLYSFVRNPGQIDPTFLGLINLGKIDTTLALPLATAGLQFVQARMLLPAKPPPGAEAAPGTNISRQLVYIFPVVTGVFALTLPAALPLYWAASTLFTVVQQYVIIRELPLAKARAEGAADWNAANPGDPVPARPALKAKKSRSKKRGSTVTVRRRGEG